MAMIKQEFAHWHYDVIIGKDRDGANLKLLPFLRIASVNLWNVFQCMALIAISPNAVEEKEVK